MAATHPRWMNESHIVFEDAATKFFEAELVPNIDKWREAGVVDKAFWRKAGEAGLMGGSIPEEFGGAGGDLGHEVVVLRTHGRTGDSGWGYGVQNIVIHYVNSYGTDEQKKRWLPKLVMGEWVGAIAMTEPGTGSDLQSVKTYAVKDGDDYVINGSKTFITNGTSADLVIVVAKTDREQGARGISLIGVETENCPGYRVGRRLDKLGLKSQDTSELFFEDVRTPQSYVMGGGEGQGFFQLMNQLPWERLQIGLGSLSASEVAFRETLAYVKERKAFGKRLLDFQNTQFKMAEVKTKLEVMRSFINDCIEKCIAGELDAPTASMAKWWGSQTQGEIIDECLQLFGGYGFMNEYPIARLYADARVQKIYGGTNEIQKMLIARSLDG
ncbi:MAG: acyl-CoA dehydrogenase family protein [Alphaproteobacteria bacterium]